MNKCIQKFFSNNSWLYTFSSKFISLFFLVLNLLYFIPQSSSALIKDIDFTNYGSFIFYNDTPDTLYFFSDIQSGDSFQLRKALRNHNINKIFLSSFGGSVFEGLQMAGIIYDKGLNTFIPKDSILGKGVCASSCALMFFAGKNRKIDGDLGVHQFYFSNENQNKNNNLEADTQFIVSEIIGFLNLAINSIRG